MTKFVTIAALTLAALILAACVAEKKKGANSLPVGAAMPEFSLSGSDGSTVSTADLAGKPTLVVLFRTTCSDCSREMPVIEEAWRQIVAAGTMPDFRIVAISKEPAATVEQYWRDAGLTMPWYLDADGAAFMAFDVHYVPTLYLFGSDGKVAYTVVETFGLSADALAGLIERLK